MGAGGDLQQARPGAARPGPSRIEVIAMLSGVARAFSDDIAIDLGTANTLVHVVGRGIIIDEPSVVAVQVRGGQRVVLAVGLKAKAMLGKTPEPIELVRPMRDGVIADFIATEEMLRQFISRAKTMLGFRRPRILICVPAGATPVERRAVYETAVSAGARKVYLIEEPVAASLGAGLPIDGPVAFMVVDIGGGTSDIAVLWKGEVVQARSLRVAGNAMDEAIMRYVRRQHGLVIGEGNAERIKIEAGTALAKANGRQVEIHIKGRDLKEGRFKTVVLGPRDMAEALAGPVGEIAEFIQRALEDLTPEIAEQVARRGIVLTGGGALLERLDVALKERVGAKFVLPESPMHCVIKGTATVLQQLPERQHLLIGP
jgi:rod shape-determining protein MreB